MEELKDNNPINVSTTISSSIYNNLKDLWDHTGLDIPFDNYLNFMYDPINNKKSFSIVMDKIGSANREYTESVLHVFNHKKLPKSEKIKILKNINKKYLIDNLSVLKLYNDVSNNVKKDPNYKTDIIFPKIEYEYNTDQPEDFLLVEKKIKDNIRIIKKNNNTIINANNQYIDAIKNNKISLKDTDSIFKKLQDINKSAIELNNRLKNYSGDPKEYNVLAEQYNDLVNKQKEAEDQILKQTGHKSIKELYESIYDKSAINTFNIKEFVSQIEGFSKNVNNFVSFAKSISKENLYNVELQRQINKDIRRYQAEGNYPMDNLALKDRHSAFREDIVLGLDNPTHVYDVFNEDNNVRNKINKIDILNKELKNSINNLSDSNKADNFQHIIDTYESLMAEFNDLKDYLKNKFNIKLDESLFNFIYTSKEKLTDPNLMLPEDASLDLLSKLVKKRAQEIYEAKSKNLNLLPYLDVLYSSDRGYDNLVQEKIRKSKIEFQNSWKQALKELMNNQNLKNIYAKNDETVFDMLLEIRRNKFDEYKVMYERLYNQSNKADNLDDKEKEKVITGKAIKRFAEDLGFPYLDKKKYSSEQKKYYYELLGSSLVKSNTSFLGIDWLGSLKYAGAQFLSTISFGNFVDEKDLQLLSPISVSEAKDMLFNYYKNLGIDEQKLSGFQSTTSEDIIRGVQEGIGSIGTIVGFIGQSIALNALASSALPRVLLLTSRFSKPVNSFLIRTAATASVTRNMISINRLTNLDSAIAQKLSTAGFKSLTATERAAVISNVSKVIQGTPLASRALGNAITQWSNHRIFKHVFNLGSMFMAASEAWQTANYNYIQNELELEARTLNYLLNKDPNYSIYSVYSKFGKINKEKIKESLIGAYLADFSLNFALLLSTNPFGFENLASSVGRLKIFNNILSSGRDIAFRKAFKISKDLMVKSKPSNIDRVVFNKIKITPKYYAKNIVRFLADTVTEVTQENIQEFLQGNIGDSIYKNLRLNPSLSSNPYIGSFLGAFDFEIDKQDLITFYATTFASAFFGSGVSFVKGLYNLNRDIKDFKKLNLLIDELNSIGLVNLYNGQLFISPDKLNKASNSLNKLLGIDLNDIYQKTQDVGELSNVFLHNFFNFLHNKGALEIFIDEVSKFNETAKILSKDMNLNESVSFISLMSGADILNDKKYVDQVIESLKEKYKNKSEEEIKNDILDKYFNHIDVVLNGLKDYQNKYHEKRKQLLEDIKEQNRELYDLLSNDDLKKERIKDILSKNNDLNYNMSVINSIADALIKDSVDYKVEENIKEKSKRIKDIKQKYLYGIIYTIIQNSENYSEENKNEMLKFITENIFNNIPESDIKNIEETFKYIIGSKYIKQLRTINTIDLITDLIIHYNIDKNVLEKQPDKIDSLSKFGTNLDSIKYKRKIIEDLNKEFLLIQNLKFIDEKVSLLTYLDTDYKSSKKSFEKTLNEYLKRIDEAPLLDNNPILKKQLKSLIESLLKGQGFNVNIFNAIANNASNIINESLVIFENLDDGIIDYIWNIYMYDLTEEEIKRLDSLPVDRKRKKIIDYIKSSISTIEKNIKNMTSDSKKIDVDNIKNIEKLFLIISTLENIRIISSDGYHVGQILSDYINLMLELQRVLAVYTFNEVSVFSLLEDDELLEYILVDNSEISNLITSYINSDKNNRLEIHNNVRALIYSDKKLKNLSNNQKESLVLTIIGLLENFSRFYDDIEYSLTALNELLSNIKDPEINNAKNINEIISKIEETDKKLLSLSSFIEKTLKKFKHGDISDELVSEFKRIRSIIHDQIAFIEETKSIIKKYSKKKKEDSKFFTDVEREYMIKTISEQIDNINRSFLVLKKLMGSNIIYAGANKVLIATDKSVSDAKNALQKLNKSNKFQFISDMLIELMNRKTKFDTESYLIQQIESFIKSSNNNFFGVELFEFNGFSKYSVDYNDYMSNIFGYIDDLLESDKKEDGVTDVKSLPTKSEEAPETDDKRKETQTTEDKVSGKELDKTVEEKDKKSNWISPDKDIVETELYKFIKSYNVNDELIQKIFNEVFHILFNRNLVDKEGKIIDIKKEREILRIVSDVIRRTEQTKKSSQDVDILEPIKLLEDTLSKYIKDIASGDLSLEAYYNMLNYLDKSKNFLNNNINKIDTNTYNRLISNINMLINNIKARIKIIENNKDIQKEINEQIQKEEEELNNLAEEVTNRLKSEKQDDKEVEKDLSKTGDKETETKTEPSITEKSKDIAATDQITKDTSDIKIDEEKELYPDLIKKEDQEKTIDDKMKENLKLAEESAIKIDETDDHVITKTNNQQPFASSVITDDNIQNISNYIDAFANNEIVKKAVSLIGSIELLKEKVIEQYINQKRKSEGNLLKFINWFKKISQLDKLTINHYVKILTDAYIEALDLNAIVSSVKKKERMQTIKIKNKKLIDEVKQIDVPDKILVAEKEIKLNNQQKEALKYLSAFLQLKEEYNDKMTTKEKFEEWKRNNVFTLMGYAGTGKTTIIKYIKDVSNSKFLFTAPTHKAKGVLKGLISDAPVETLHRALGFLPDFDIRTANLSNINTAKKRPSIISYYNVIVIDEASMINETMYDYLLKEAYDYGMKIIFMGDPAQLPPVNEKKSKAFTDVYNIYELTEVERQQNTNPLSFLLEDIRDNLESAEVNISYQDKINLETKDGYIFRNSKGIRKIINQNKEIFKNPETANTIKILAWKNETVDYYNRLVREIIHGEKEKQHKFLPNDVLVVKGNLRPVGIADPLENSNELVVLSVTEIEESEGMKGWDLKVRIKSSDDSNSSVNIRILDTSDKHTADIIRERYIDFKKRISDAYRNGYYREGSKIYNDFLDWRSSFGIIDNLTINNKDVLPSNIGYGFAMTTHKAQGSTYDVVIVDIDDITSNKEKVERNQLIYTALSRTTSLAIIKTDYAPTENTINDEIINEKIKKIYEDHINKKSKEETKEQKPSIESETDEKTKNIVVETSEKARIAQDLSKEKVEGEIIDEKKPFEPEDDTNKHKEKPVEVQVLKKLKLEEDHDVRRINITLKNKKELECLVKGDENILSSKKISVFSPESLTKEEENHIAKVIAELMKNSYTIVVMRESNIYRIVKNLSKVYNKKFISITSSSMEEAKMMRRDENEVLISFIKEKAEDKVSKARNYILTYKNRVDLSDYVVVAMPDDFGSSKTNRTSFKDSMKYAFKHNVPVYVYDPKSSIYTKRQEARILAENLVQNNAIVFKENDLIEKIESLPIQQEVKTPAYKQPTLFDTENLSSTSYHQQEPEVNQQKESSDLIENIKKEPSKQVEEESKKISTSEALSKIKGLLSNHPVYGGFLVEVNSIESLMQFLMSFINQIDNKNRNEMISILNEINTSNLDTESLSYLEAIIDSLKPDKNVCK
ncbi:MAG: hypothetical protein KatS3mg002_1343 [Candidatus Woesearchaeota archaeon]|nr:MAG: hypothetical protein KatS3mg002_1343 [Candidatus Woesearchaeota archaeon]